MTAPRLRIVAFNDVYELANLPKIQTFLSQLSPPATAVCLSGDFLSPSTLSMLDGGRGMVATLRAMGLTHASIGNHEADLKLSVLQKRLEKLSKSVVCLNSNIGRPKDPNFAPWWTPALTPPYSIIQTPCQRVNVALTGFLTDEKGIFRDNTFRGAPILSVTDVFQKLHQELVPTGIADLVIPMTHQSITRDRELADFMLNQIGTGSGLILGGHEHEPFDAIVSSEQEAIRILKSGCDAKAVSLIDLTFDLEGDRPRLAECEAELVEMAQYKDSVVVGGIVDSHMAIVRKMENETIVNADNLLPPGTPLSSKGTRWRQTTVGGVFCHAIREELEVDVAIINGATIKGNKEYTSSSITYAELKKELPFPTKFVVIPMKRWELQEAIQYSRTQPLDDKAGDDDPDPSDEPFERRGYLQVDVEFDRIGFHTGGQDDDLMVALPRNLMKGFCKIKPLMAIGGKLKLLGTFPSEDDYIRGIDLLVRHFCKERWFEIVHDHAFHELDLNNKGVLDRNDVKRLLHKTIGHEPADFVVDDMIAAIDTDENGVIDPGEYSHLLAIMEREHGLLKFDN